ncbi:kelch repeat-containing protein [Sorangium sp. So ce327]|uniref:kelch repeat-containing protein n=1 Tax=Sorangium sp. So ce327 TaxID=3133301 RepID=UPI003F5FB890
MQTSSYLGVALACAALVLPAGEVWADGTPSWEQLPAMITPRSGHTATLLQDGRVLVAGGYGSDRITPLREVEIYGPASKTWAPAAPLRSPLREVAATAILPSGLALSTDGEHVEVYSPDLDQWQAAAPLTPALTAPRAVALPSGKLMMLGQASGSLAGSIYDDAAGAWTPIRSLSGAIARSATVLRDSRVLVTGNGRANIYDPETDSWTPTARVVLGSTSYATTRLASGDVLFVGGYPFMSTHPSQLYLPEENLWVAISGHDPFYDPYPDCFPEWDYDMGLGVSRLLSGRVLLTGGMVTYICGYPDENGQILNEWRYSEFGGALELYDPAWAVWRPLDVEPPETMARAYHTSTRLDDGSVLIAGGLVASGSPRGAPAPTASALLFHERAPLGAACEAGGDCASGFCADSVCCDAACAGPCDVCAASAGATKDGACTPISGTPCDDTGACLKGGVCEAGTCAGGTPAPDGTPCVDAEMCSATSTCEGGACVGASPASCQAPDGCHEAPACDPALGCSGPAPEKPDGALCDVAGTPDAWQAAARMPSEMKRALRATLLEDGTVLVIGVENSSAAPLRAMRYDPSMDRWQLVGGIPQVRSSVTLHVTRLHDGTVLVTSHDRVDRFNPATGEWEGAAPMLRTHGLGTATLLQDGRVLVTGGSDASAEVYDPAADAWTWVAPTNTQRYHHSATLLQDGRVLVAGGDEVAGAEVYDPSAGVWTPVASMSQARGSHKATLLPDGRVLVVGGNSEGIALATAELYDPASDIWTPAAEMVARRYATKTVLLADGRVLLAGNLGVQYSLDYTVELYDPATDIWSLGPAMDLPITEYVPVRLDDGRVLMVGGELGSISYPSPLVHLYVPGQRPSRGVCQAGVCLQSAGGEGGAGGGGGDASGSGGGEGGAGGSGGDAGGTGGSGGALNGAGGSGGDAAGTGGSGGDASGSGANGSGGGASGAGGNGDAASGGGVSGNGGSGDATSGAGGSGGDASGSGASGGGGGVSGTGGAATGAGGSGGDASGAGGSDGTTSTSAGANSGTGEGGSAGDTGAQSGAGGGSPSSGSGGWHCQMGPGIQGTPTWLVLAGGLAALRVRRRSPRIRGAA